jgi:hypothetical protein
MKGSGGEGYMTKFIRAVMVLMMVLGLTAGTAQSATDVAWDITPGTDGVGNGTVTGGSGALYFLQ